jgi:glycosyltransferase involved in cell wall biosynthesis
MRSVRRTLERHHIDPVLFHLRYSDNASSCVITLAKKLGKKVVFTLTPDPHRNFSDRDGLLHSLPESTAMRDVNKVFVADRIVSQTDSIVLIGHRNKNNQILPYFPQLWLDAVVRKKPLKIMAEGVRTSFSYLHGTGPEDFTNLLFHHDGSYKLDDAAPGKPLMLNVGRLDPMKGQGNLFDAWVHSPLNTRYNLVLIGGNIGNPDPVESKLLEHIDLVMKEGSHLRGRFCHIPALPNPTVRLLEQSITQTLKTPYPHLYVCSSYKEEFGISILEAMVSGLLVVAPQKGGVSSYVVHGKTGFLIDTRNADTIESGLHSVLDPAHNSADRLHSIARQGQAMVKRTFNIKQIAEDYSRFYWSIIGEKRERAASTPSIEKV